MTLTWSWNEVGPRMEGTRIHHGFLLWTIYSFKALGWKEGQPVTASRARSSFASFAWLALWSSMTCKELVSLWKRRSQWVNSYGYGSIPINTIFSGMNIHLPAILMFTRGTRFWHTAISKDAGFVVFWVLVRIFQWVSSLCFYYLWTCGLSWNCEKKIGDAMGMLIRQQIL